MAHQNEIPNGYRQAITTAITVFLGFSITLLRSFWKVQSTSGWSISEKIDEFLIAIGIILQMISLFRAISLSDNDEIPYKKTKSLFSSGVIFVVIGVVVGVFVRS